MFEKQDPPKFQLVKSSKVFSGSIPLNAPQLLRDYSILLPALNQPAVLDFLSPLEILSLWRTCKGTWNNAMSVPASKRWDCIRKSLYRYLYISQEAADRVHQEMEGGWSVGSAFLFRLLGLCEHLSRVYGPFEPDPAHRAFLAESCCFYHLEDIDGGELLNHAALVDDPSEEPLPVPTLEKLRTRAKLDEEMDEYSTPDDCKVLWGESDRIRSADVDNEWWQANQDWMKNNANLAPNANYKLRIEHGCDPIIWLMYNCQAETIQYGLGIGPNGEQLLQSNCFYIEGLAECEPNQFRTCSNRNDLELYNGGHILKGGVADFLICFTDLEEDTNLGVLIWCFRRGFVSCTKADIEQLIQKAANGDSFLLQALESDKFGLAKIDF